MPRLSVCIPTYNFGEFIGATLESILSQCGEDTEVLVVDGASTDNTAEVVAQHRQKYPQLKYHLLDRKGGIDVDMARSVELATGDYCWLFSSDDLMVEGAIGRILAHLQGEPDVLLCTHMNCSFDMEPRHQHPVLDLGADADFDLGDPDQRRRYFASAITTEAFFSFMTGLVIRRDTWNTNTLDPDFTGSCWAHAVRLLQINARSGLKVRYLHQPLVLRRGDNDSFASQGLVKRFAIAIEGYNRIADTLFGADSAEAVHIRRCLRNEYTLPHFLYAKYLARKYPETEDIAHLDRLVKVFYDDPGLRLRFAVLTYKLANQALLSLAVALRARLTGRAMP